MKLPLILLSLLISSQLLSQESKITLKVSPLALVDAGSFGTINAGIEYRFSDRIGWYNEIGIAYRKPYHENADTIHISSTPKYKIKSELRYYFQKADHRNWKKNWDNDAYETYIALNFYYIKDVHNTAISYYYQRDTSARRIDNFGSKKSVAGFNFIIGKQVPIFNSEHIYIDVYSGFGPRWRFVETVNKEFDKKRDRLITWRHPNVHDMRAQTDAFAGTSVVPNFTMGIRICYHF